jgi:DNA-directed RNA polymerase specialized sigma subunit
MQIENNYNKSLITELENWGWWAQDDIKLGYGSGSTSSGRSIAITDSRAMQLDRAIASLDERPKKAMRLRFICGFDEQRLAQAFKISEESGAQLVSNSVEKVSDYLLHKSAA